MNDVKTISNGKLKIKLDVTYLNMEKERLIEYVKANPNDELTNKKNKIISIEKFIEEINRLCNIALDIVSENPSFNIFDYLPLTKAGQFHKTKSILVATSNIKDVFNGDYFSMSVLDLRLVPVTYADKTNPFLFTDANNFPFATSFNGDGITTYLELGWFAHRSKELPILDENNKASKNIVTRNTYLKQDIIKEGYVYEDAKNNKFLYLGKYFTEDIKYCSNKEFANETKFLASEVYKTFVNRMNNYSPDFCYLKITKKIENLLQNCNTLDEVFNVLMETEFYGWYYKFKWLSNPLKVIKECDKMVEPILNKNWFEKIEGKEKLQYYIVKINN